MVIVEEESGWEVRKIFMDVEVETAPLIWEKTTSVEVPEGIVEVA